MLRRIPFHVLYFLFLSVDLFAVRSVGLKEYRTGNQDGYVLFSPIPSTNAYLINKCGEKVHEWSCTAEPGLSAFLLEDGSLLRTFKTGNSVFTLGGNGGGIEKRDWNGNLTWSYLLSDSNQCQHHDILPLPNGNVLAIVWDRRTSAEAIANGKNPANTLAYIWSEKIVELQITGPTTANIVWEWKAWDHLVQDFDPTKLNYGSVENNPQLIDINFTQGPLGNLDWIHLNSIDYNPQTDQILVSSHTLHEIWILDHSTTTAEAASHTGGNSGRGGDLLFRWGNPQSYRRGVAADRKLFSQHHATWIPQGYPNEGKIILFNNGLNRPGGGYSSIDMLAPVTDTNNQYLVGPSQRFLPDTLHWQYTPPVVSDFYAVNLSGVYPLDNGSFFITNGPIGTFFEIDSTEQTIWKYVNPVSNNGILSQGSTPSANSVFRAHFYPLDYPAFTGRALNSLGEIELNPQLPGICDSLSVSVEQQQPDADFVSATPNPVHDRLTFRFKRSNREMQYRLFSITGKEIVNGILTADANTIDMSTFDHGVYFILLTEENSHRSIRVIKE